MRGNKNWQRNNLSAHSFSSHFLSNLPKFTLTDVPQELLKEIVERKYNLETLWLAKTKKIVINLLAAELTISLFTYNYIVFCGTNNRKGVRPLWRSIIVHLKSTSGCCTRGYTVAQIWPLFPPTRSPTEGLRKYFINIL